MTATQEFTGYIIDQLSRDAGCPEAVGYFRPLRASDIPDAEGPIDPRWVWVEWWLTMDDIGDAQETVGWREGDAVFVPADACRGNYEYDERGPQGRWMLSERPHAIVINMPEGDGRNTLAVWG